MTALVAAKLPTASDQLSVFEKLPATRCPLPAVAKKLPAARSPLPAVAVDRSLTATQPQNWTSSTRQTKPKTRQQGKSRQRVAGSRQFSSRQREAGSGQLTSHFAACLWIPNFPLRAEERRRPELSGKPTALISTTDTRKVWQLSPIARRQGVQSGMTVSQAIGLCPTLTILEPDPVYYDEQFASILASLTKISPVVEPVELGRAYVGVDGLERLVGDPAKQLRTIEHILGSDRGIRRWINHKRAAGSRQPAAGVVRQGWEGLRLGWARGKFASWVAACRAKPGQPVILRDSERMDFLSEQSIAVLPVETDTQRRLWQLGIKTLKKLAALPKEAVISQFGREGQTAWQLATGLIVEPVYGKRPPENITTSIEFPLPVADRQILRYAIGKLIERSLRDPRRIGWRVQTLRIRGSLEHGSSWLTEIILKDPTADLKNICAPIDTKLEQTPPTGAVENITVEFTSLIRGTSELQLFARDASSAARAGRQKALRWASKEIQKRLNQSMLHHIIEVHPWSRLPERRYALIDYDP